MQELKRFAHSHAGNKRSEARLMQHPSPNQVTNQSDLTGCQGALNPALLKFNPEGQPALKMVNEPLNCMSSLLCLCVELGSGFENPDLCSLMVYMV